MASSEQRLALVIGIGAYNRSEVQPLRGATQDARSVADALRQQPGFINGVTFQINLGRRDLMVQLELHTKKLAEAQTSLSFFYFSGHAMVDSQGIQYLVCKDFERMEGNRDAALDQYGIKVATVLNYVTKASRAVLIIDACRNKEISVGDPGVHCLENLAGAIVVYSCAYGSVAMNGANGGCYAEHVLKHIFDPNKSIYQGIRDAKEATCQDSEGSQDPQNQVDALALYENYYIGRANGGLPAADLAATSYGQHGKLIAEFFKAKQLQNDLHKEYQQALDAKKPIETELLKQLQLGRQLICHDGQQYNVEVSEIGVQVAQMDFVENLKEDEAVCEGCKLRAIEAFKHKRRTKRTVKVNLEAVGTQHALNTLGPSGSESQRKRPRSAEE